MIVTVSSVRGSPGVTTWALLLGGAWPEELGVERVVLEADVDGGVLGARYDLGVDPGVVSLVTAMRRDPSSVPVSDHTRQVAPGVGVAPAPETAEQAYAVWAGVADVIASACGRDERVWIVDCGRVDARAPQVAFVKRAAHSLLLSGGRTEDLVQLPTRVTALQQLGADVSLLIIGKPANRRDEIAAFAGAEVIGVVDHDPDAFTIAGSAVGGGRARRSWLWRSALDVTAEVARRATATKTDIGGALGNLQVVDGTR